MPSWVTNEHGFGTLGIAADVRVRKNGQLMFNREPVTTEKLTEYSKLLREMDPRVFVAFAIDEGAKCEQVNAVRAILDAGLDCKGAYDGRCGEGPGPWPVFADVPPFPIVQEYQDGKYRWLENGVSDEEWLTENVRPLSKD